MFAVAAGLKLAGLAAGQGMGASGGSGATIFGGLPWWAQGTLVAAELLLAVWLAGGWRPQAAAFSTLVMLSAFLAAVLIEMEKANPRSCGCLGALAPRQATASLALSLGLDCLMILLALWVYFSAPAAPNPSTRVLTSDTPGD